MVYVSWTHVSHPKDIITETEWILEQTVAPQAGRVLSEPAHSTVLSLMSISSVHLLDTLTVKNMHIEVQSNVQ